MTDAEKLAALRCIVASVPIRPHVVRRLIAIGLVEDMRQPGDPFGPRLGLTLGGKLVLEAGR